MKIYAKKQSLFFQNCTIVKIKALKAGSATVVAKVGKKKYTCKATYGEITKDFDIILIGKTDLTSMFKQDYEAVGKVSDVFSSKDLSGGMSIVEDGDNHYFQLQQDAATGNRGALTLRYCNSCCFSYTQKVAPSA